MEYPVSQFDSDILAKKVDFIGPAGLIYSRNWKLMSKLADLANCSENI